MLYKLIPDTGPKSLPQDKFQTLPSRRCLQILLPPSGVGFGEEIFTVNEAEWAAGCGSFGLAVEVFGQATL